MDFYKESEECLSACYNKNIELSSSDLTKDEVTAIIRVSPIAVNCGLQFNELYHFIKALRNFKPQNVGIELRKMLVRLDAYPYAKVK